jgi:hypothetical protein
MNLPQFLLGLIAAAECNHGLTACLGGSHSVGNVGLGQLFDVEGDLLVEFFVPAEPVK